MKKWIAQSRKFILFLLPLAFGLIGLAGVAGEPFLNSLYQCIGMYLMDYGDTPPNVFVEIARWTAPLATASWVVFAFVALRRVLGSWLQYLRADSVAVYGPEPVVSLLLDRLGSRGVAGGHSLLPAHRYILVGPEEKSLSFYREHQQALADKPVYFQSRSLSPLASNQPLLKFFCPEANAARLFWQTRELYPISRRKAHHLQIVLLGFGRLGEELLLRGLLVNIFAPDQCIQYHIFGTGDRFEAVHKGIAQVEDPVIFHREPWYAQLNLIEQADLLLVLEQEDQPRLLEDLLLATTRQEIDVFAGDTLAISPLEQNKRLRLFPWEQMAYTPEILLDDSLMTRAKAINLRYCHLYDKVAETAENREAEWAKLDSFTRESNISAADYHLIRLEMLKDKGLPASAENLPGQTLELLAELEHIRWCRYHYLHNWTWGQPEGGKRKDPVRRIHADLLPYGQLTEAEKEKDRENIRILLSVE